VPESRISVVIPACNAEAHLPRCLSALKAEADPGLEIILVDDASVDGTAALAESMGVAVLRQQGNHGPSAARNAGARAARGEYLMFVDSDVAIHPGGLARVRALLDSRPEIAAVFGSYDAEPAEKGLITEYRNLLHHYTHQQGNPEASTFWSGCGAVRRQVFSELGGFDEKSHPRSIEDIELGYRMRAAGHRILLDKDLLCTHMKRWTLSSMIRTDVMGRAIPWTRLNLDRRAAPNDLNIKLGQKLCVVLMAIALLSLPLALVSPWFLAGGAAALLGIVVLNAPMFAHFARRHGAGFAVRTVPLHLLYYLYSGLSYAYVRIFHALGLTIVDGNSPRGRPLGAADTPAGR